MKNPAPVLLFLIALTTGYFFQSGVDNEAARFAQTRAIVEEGTFAIDRFAYRSADIIKFNDHYYPGKAPGLSLLAVPFWILYSHLLDLSPLAPPLKEHAICYAVTWTICGSSLALLTLVFFRLAVRTGCSEQSALLTATGLAFGTILLPFSTVLFGHLPAALLLLLAFSLTISHPRSAKYAAFAGLLSGLGVCIEYPIAIGGFAIGGWLLLRSGISSAVGFSIGAVLGSAPALLYHWIVFGDPFFTPYTAYAEDPAALYSQHQSGLLGITLPSAEIIRRVLIGLQRGLFVFNPWLMLGLAAVALRKTRNPEIIFCFTIFLLYLFMNGGYGESIIYWGGGASLGPRHLIPALPFLALLSARVMTEYPWTRMIGAPLILGSSILMIICTAVEPRTPYDYFNPLLNFYLPFYLQGEFSSQWYGVFSSTPVTDDSVATNFGALLSLPQQLQLLPLFLVFGIFWISKVQRRYRALNFSVIACFASIPFFWGVSPESSSGISRLVTPAVIPESPSEFPRNHQTVSVLDRALHFPHGLNLPPPFSAEWSGELTIPTDGEWSLGLESDDGSALYLAGELLVDNWGEHGMTLKLSPKELKAGRYPFIVRYYDVSGGGGITLYWKRSGEHLRPIPNWAFTQEDR